MAAPQTYSLPPDKLERAIEYAHSAYWLHFSSEIWAIAILAAILGLGLAAKYRDWAVAASARRLVQAAIFVPLLLLTNDILYLPANLYGQHLELKFDQSIQSWPSWFWDWSKGELIEVICAIPLAWLLFAVIRKSARRWWLYFWLAALPIIAGVMYLEPMVIEPLFFKFEPLAATQPALVNQLEQLTARAGLVIPRDRMFEMKASEKLNSLNAYVSGFGGSKRVVVWDTTLQKLTTPEVLFVWARDGALRAWAHPEFADRAGAGIAACVVCGGADCGCADRAIWGAMEDSGTGRLGVAAAAPRDLRDLQFPG